MLNQEPTPPEGLTPVQASEYLINRLGSLSPGEVLTGDEQLIAALRALRGDLNSEPIPDDDADVLALAEQQAARNLVVAAQAAQVVAAQVIVPTDRFAAWVALAEVDYIAARWVQHLNRVHAWIDYGARGLELTVTTWCTEITGYDIGEGDPAVTIPAAEVGRLVAVTTQGGAR